MNRRFSVLVLLLLSLGVYSVVVSSFSQDVSRPLTYDEMVATSGGGCQYCNDPDLPCDATTGGDCYGCGGGMPHSDVVTGGLNKAHCYAWGNAGSKYCRSQSALCGSKKRCIDEDQPNEYCYQFTEGAACLELTNETCAEHTKQGTEMIFETESVCATE